MKTGGPAKLPLYRHKDARGSKLGRKILNAKHEIAVGHAMQGYAGLGPIGSG